VEAASPFQNIDSHGYLICPWLKEYVTNMWINFFYMKPKFKEPHVAMKSCSPQTFLSYFAPVEFISFGSREGNKARQKKMMKLAVRERKDKKKDFGSTPFLPASSYCFPL
jgi:hypothetical protein